MLYSRERVRVQSGTYYFNVHTPGSVINTLIYSEDLRRRSIAKLVLSQLEVKDIDFRANVVRYLTSVGSE